VGGESISITNGQKKFKLGKSSQVFLAGPIGKKKVREGRFVVGDLWFSRANLLVSSVYFSTTFETPEDQSPKWLVG
jgi:hypothetical protein